MAVRMDKKQARELETDSRRSRGEQFEADFAEPRSIEILAEEHRRFLATITEPLEDVELPPDD